MNILSFHLFIICRYSYRQRYATFVELQINLIKIMSGLAFFNHKCFCMGSEDHCETAIRGNGIETEKGKTSQRRDCCKYPYFLVMSCLSGKTAQQAYKVGSTIWRLIQQHCTFIESWVLRPKPIYSYILDSTAKTF